MWARIKKLDHYRRSVIGGWLVALGLIGILLFLQAPNLFSDVEVLNFLIIPTLAANIISSSTYLGRLIDFFQPDFPTDNTNPSKPSRRVERFFTVIGLILGLAVGILFTVAKVALPFTATIGAFANALFTFTRIGAFAGLTGRISSSLAENSRSAPEKIAILTTAAVGVGVGVALFCTTNAALFGFAGITSILTGGMALPLWLAGIIFVSTFTSTMTSCGDYTGKIVAYFQHKNADTPTGKAMRDRKHECEGAAYGASLGLIVAAVAVTLVMLSQPYLFAGIVGLASAAFLAITIVTLCSALGSRTGKALHGLSQKPPKALDGKVVSPKNSPRFIADALGPRANVQPAENATSQPSTVVGQQPPQGYNPTLLSAPPAPILVAPSSARREQSPIVVI